MSIVYGHTTEWKKSDIEIVKRAFGAAPFDVYIGETTGCSIHHKLTDIKDVHIATMYQMIHKVFIIWNASKK